MEIKLDKIFFKSEKIHAIVGPSNSGKTKLLSYIWKNYLEQTSVYIQNVNDFFLMKTVKEELNFSNLQKSYQNDILDIMLSVGLEEKDLDRKINTLTLSEKSKLELACVLLQNKDIILLDEPIIYLDQKEKQNLIKLLKKLKRNKTIVITTKDLAFALEVCDDICLYYNEILYFDIKNEAMKNMDWFEKEELSIPPTLEFSNKVKNKKNISIGYRLEINDLIKDIYRNVT